MKLWLVMVLSILLLWLLSVRRVATDARLHFPIRPNTPPLVAQMQIRRLSKSDASVLQEGRLNGLSESPEAFLATYADIEGIPLSEVEKDLADQNILYLGAFDNSSLVGMIRHVRPDRRSRRHTAEVRSVYVRLSHRGQGLAHRLLSQLIEESRQLGLESLTLSVLASNDPARRLYESLGFSVYGREPKAIKKGDELTDQLHLWLDLTAT